MKKYGLSINRGLTESTSDETIETKNPTTGEAQATFSQRTRENVVKAIEAAEKAFPKCNKYPAPKRGEIQDAPFTVDLVNDSYWSPEVGGALQG